MNDPIIYYADAARELYPARRFAANPDTDYSTLSTDDGLPLPTETELREYWLARVPPLEWSIAEFLRLFTAAERSLIRIQSASGTSPIAAAAQDALELQDPVRDRIRSDSSTLISLLNGLVSIGILDPSRPAQILAGQPPGA